MMHYLLVILLSTLSTLSIAQNLVPNPSFEDTIQVNGQPGLIKWQNNIGSPDYFSSYFIAPLERFKTPINMRGNELPLDGMSYIGLGVYDLRSTNFREYLQIQLSDTLQNGIEYEIQFYLSLADTFHLAVSSNDIGFVFSDTLIPNNFDHLIREIQPFYNSDSIWNASNKNGWEKFHYTYNATGNERVLIIGNFRPDHLVTIDSIGTGGSSSFFTSTSYYYIDLISVTEKDTSTSIPENALLNSLKYYPNPVGDIFYVENKSTEVLQFQLYNQLGQEIEINQPSRNSTNRYELSLGHLPKGIYLLRATSTDSKMRQQAIIKLIKR